MQSIQTQDGWFLRLEVGEKVMHSLVEFAGKQNILSASVIGLGAVKNTKLGVYYLETKKYDERIFAQTSELVNLTGNLAWFEGKPAAHCHVTIGDHDFRAYCGHLFEMESAVTVELFINTQDKKIERAYEENIGLNLMQLGHCEITS